MRSIFVNKPNWRFWEKKGMNTCKNLNDIASAGQINPFLANKAIIKCWNNIDPRVYRHVKSTIQVSVLFTEDFHHIGITNAKLNWCKETSKKNSTHSYPERITKHNNCKTYRPNQITYLVKSHTPISVSKRWHPQQCTAHSCKIHWSQKSYLPWRSTN